MEPPGVTFQLNRNTRGISGFFKSVGRFALEVAGGIWGAPNSVLGLAIGLAGVPFGATFGFGNHGIQFKHYPWGAKWGRALTLGNVQIYTADNNPLDKDYLYHSPDLLEVGRHEQGHTVESYFFGPAFLPLYFLSGGLPGDNHPFELGANEFARGGSAIP